MHVVILAAGFARRLGWLGQKTAKALLPVRGTLCCLDQLVGACARAGLPNIHIVHNKLFRNQFRKWRKVADKGVWPGPVYPHIVSNDANDENEKLGAVGDLEFVVKRLGNYPGPILILCGDNFYASVEKGRVEGGSPAITIRKVGSMVFGVVGKVERDEPGSLLSISNQSAKSGEWAFAGPAFLNAESIPFVYEYCALKRSTGSKPDNLGDFFSWLVQRNNHVRCIESFTPFVDIGSRISYDKARIIIGRLFYG